METDINRGKVYKKKKCSSLFLVSQFVLRLLATTFAAVSIVLLLISEEDIYMGNETFGYLFVGKARYSYSSALSYKLVVDAGVCVFSTLSAMLVFRVLKCSKMDTDSSFYLYVLILDGAMMTMVISGCAGATAIGFVALKGLNKPGISWAPVCPYAPKFCLRVTLSMASSYVALACLAALTFIAAYKLKSLAID